MSSRLRCVEQDRLIQICHKLRYLWYSDCPWVQEIFLERVYSLRVGTELMMVMESGVYVSTEGYLFFFMKQAYIEFETCEEELNDFSRSMKLMILI